LGIGAYDSDVYAGIAAQLFNHGHPMIDGVVVIAHLDIRNQEKPLLARPGITLAPATPTTGALTGSGRRRRLSAYHSGRKNHCDRYDESLHAYGKHNSPFALWGIKGLCLSRQGVKKL
jgi:hypothetical protein